MVHHLQIDAWIFMNSLMFWRMTLRSVTFICKLPPFRSPGTAHVPLINTMTFTPILSAHSLSRTLCYRMLHSNPFGKLPCAYMEAIALAFGCQLVAVQPMWAAHGDITKILSQAVLIAKEGQMGIQGSVREDSRWISAATSRRGSGAGEGERKFAEHVRVG